MGKAIRKVSKAMGKDLRGAPRADISLGVEIKIAGSDEQISATVVNISEGGAFISTKTPASVGEKISLTIHLDKKKLTVKPHAKIVYSSSEGGKQEDDLKSVEEMRKWLSGKMRDGWGVMFTNISEEDSKLLHAFVIAVKD